MNLYYFYENMQNVVSKHLKMTKLQNVHGGFPFKNPTKEVYSALQGT